MNYWILTRDNKYGHLSTWMWGSHSLHIGDGKRLGSNRCFQQLPIYWAFQKWSSYVICDVETNGWIKKWLDNNLFKLGLSSHLWMEMLGGADFMYDLINVSKGKVSMYISDRAWMESLTVPNLTTHPPIILPNPLYTKWLSTFSPNKPKMAKYWLFRKKSFKVNVQNCKGNPYDKIWLPCSPWFS
jgi:hypothetical protein